MLPKLEGPTSVKRIKLPPSQKDILDLAESHVSGSEEAQTNKVEDETVETTTSSDSIVCGSYGSSLDLGFVSNESSFHNDLNASATGSETNDFFGNATQNEICDGSFEIGDCEANFDYNSILHQFDAFFRGKLDAELALFQESMHSMLTEQQIHVRKIISSASQDNSYEVDTEVKPVESAVPTDDASLVVEGIEEFRCLCQESQKKEKNELFIEILSLSCQLTELLSQKK
ncbi:hypothetical protein EGW08_001519, partial [Elysia chlorotica]